MAENDVSVRELALLLGRKKTAVSRVICGQFVRTDERLQIDLARITCETVGDSAWKAFTMRRLKDRANPCDETVAAA